MATKNLLIESMQNANIKQLLALQQKSSERKKTKLFVVEGMRELHYCKLSGFEIVKLFVCNDFITDSDDLSANAENTFFVSPKVYEKIAYRGGTEGVIAIVKERRFSLSNLSLPANPLVVVLEGVEKPGNIGAILRSADAAHADAVILCDVPTDLFNPNIVRSSLGTIFTVPVVQCQSADCIEFLKQKKFSILTAQLQDSSYYYDVNMRQSTAIVFGTEATGLTDLWRKAADTHIKIPMLGQIDSLNVSVSAAILLFEAVRQRMQV